MASNRNTCLISGNSIANVEETNRVHLMPCQIEHDGKANVGAYFDRIVQQERQDERQSAGLVRLENDRETKTKFH